MSVDLKDIERVTQQFETAEAIGTELKRVQSVKCRLKKQKGRSDYELHMTETLAYEQVLKEARALLEPSRKAVTQYEQSDVDALDFDETVKAIRSIQSKKTLSRWLTDVEGDNDEFRKALAIEAMLTAHRDLVKPVDEGHIRKSDLLTVIETIETSGKLTQAKIVSLLRGLI
jgi:hypothetical protein